jgi:hypothetical protein
MARLGDQLRNSNLRSKTRILNGILLLTLRNFCVFMFNKIYQNSDLKITTFYCRITRHANTVKGVELATLKVSHLSQLVTTLWKQQIPTPWSLLHNLVTCLT